MNILSTDFYISQEFRVRNMAILIQTIPLEREKESTNVEVMRIIFIMVYPLEHTRLVHC